MALIPGVKHLLRYLLVGGLGGLGAVGLARVVAMARGACVFFCRPELAGTAGVLAGLLAMVLLDFNRPRPSWRDEP